MVALLSNRLSYSKQDSKLETVEGIDLERGNLINNSKNVRRKAEMELESQVTIVENPMNTAIENREHQNSQWVIFPFSL